MTQAPRPTPGKPLDQDSVKLLMPGDWLKHYAQGACSVVASANRKAPIVTDLAGDAWTDEAHRFTFLGRPDASGFIPWAGGENPLPGGRVDVRWTGGLVETHPADVVSWREGGVMVEAWRPHLSEAAPSNVAVTSAVAWRPISEARVWGEYLVTDGERVAVAQLAEADYGGTYWSVEAGDGAIMWEPTLCQNWPPASSPASNVAEGEARDRLEAIAADFDTLSVSTRFDGHTREIFKAARTDMLDLRKALAAPSTPETRPEQGEVAEAVARVSEWANYQHTTADQIAVQSPISTFTAGDLRTILAALDRTAAVGEGRLVAVGREEWTPCSPSWLEAHPGQCDKAPRVAAETWDGHSHYHPVHWPSPPPTGRENRLRTALERVQSWLRTVVPIGTPSATVMLRAVNEALRLSDQESAS